METVRPVACREGGRARTGGPRAGLAPARLRVLVPGCAQWSWGQRERGLVLFGSFAAGLAVAAFAWGTTTGLAVLAFAFGAHVASSVDVVRQSAFPGPGRWATFFGVSGGLAAGVYAPVLTLVTLVAWPGVQGGPVEEGYLVNCWAYRRDDPQRDHYVWFRPSALDPPRVGLVVAGRGQDVEWSGNKLRVDGRWVQKLGAPFRSARPPREMAYRVPDGHVLIDPEAGASGARGPAGLVLVAREQIVGRAWARLYPIRERQLLQ